MANSAIVGIIRGGGSGNATKIQGKDISATAPCHGQVIAYNAIENQWQPVTLSIDVFPETPTIPLSGMVLRLDASQIAGLNDNDPVETWSDISGEINHASQANSSYRGVYKTGVLNSLPVVRFDGTNDVMRTSSSSFTAKKSQSCTIAVVYITRADESVYSRRVVGVSGATGDYSPFVARSDFSNQDYPSAGSTIMNVSHNFANASSSVGSNVALLGIGVWDGTDVTYRQNGVHQDTAAISNGGNDNNNSWYIGGEYVDGGVSNPCQVDVGEVIIYNRVLETEEREQLEEYLMNKWGLS